MTDQPEAVTFVAAETPNLDTLCLRGSAPLWALTRISQADVFDQDNNEEGLQRELSRKHALEAYDYVARDPDSQFPRAFPEVVLNVRDKSVLTVATVAQHDHATLVEVTFDLAKIDRARGVKVSRMDGNHRLIFGAGDGRERPALEQMVPFQLHIGLTREQESSLFLDINANQKGLNTSHLHAMRARLTAEDVELERHPERVYARKLVLDAMSPWHDLVHLGGSKAGAKERGIVRPVTFVALETGVGRTLRKSVYLAEMAHDRRYGLLRNYWQAVRELMPEAWEEGTRKQYLVLKNLGVTTWATFGATVIDRAMAAGEVDVRDMLEIMQPARDVIDWGTESPDVAGRSGNRAALLLAGRLTEAITAGLTAA